MTPEALIIFVRKPEAGKVKTRIAAVAGDAAALQVYQKLLQHTFDITHRLPCDKYVFYADAVGESDVWSRGDFHKLQQAKGDLGLRMLEAFKLLFNKGYRKVCIIGSDCYELNANLIQNAFALAGDYDFVIGPATDGGYYLLAMHGKPTNIFENIDWSTDKVLAQTIAAIEKGPFNFRLLQPLNDIDTVDDLPDAWKGEIGLVFPKD